MHRKFSDTKVFCNLALRLKFKYSYLSGEADTAGRCGLMGRGGDGDEELDQASVHIKTVLALCSQVHIYCVGRGQFLGRRQQDEGSEYQWLDDLSLPCWSCNKIESSMSGTKTSHCSFQRQDQTFRPIMSPKWCLNYFFWTNEHP